MTTEIILLGIITVFTGWAFITLRKILKDLDAIEEIVTYISLPDDLKDWQIHMNEEDDEDER